MVLKRTVLGLFQSLRYTFGVLKENDPMRMAGATAFFTVFALPPILMIIVRILGLFFNRQTIGRQLLDKLGRIIGPEGRNQVWATIKSVLALQETWLMTAGIFLFLLFVATTLFKVIKDSINQIWNIRIKAGQSLGLMFRSRILGAAAILFTGLLFLASLFIDGILAFLGNYLQEFSPEIASYLNSFLNQAVSVLIDTVWFYMLLYYLPDGHPRKRIVLGGAVLTSILFNVGKFVLRSVLLSSNIGSLYGTSGAFVLVLLFVFYAALIFYFGTSFIKAWTDTHGDPIVPRPYATKYHISQADMGSG